MPKKNDRNTKGKIINAAWDLFYEQGYEWTTVDEIIYKSGTSKGSFYHYFEGKDALLGSLSYIFDEEYQKLINRLSRIEGQVRGIRGMVENNAYCTDILVQVSAVNAALNAFSKELLSSHIRTCVAEDIRAGKDETVDELVTTLQKLMK